MSLQIDTSIRFVWAIANAEANYAGDSRIRPLHFFIAILKIPDPKFIRTLQDSEAEDEFGDQISKTGRDICGFLEMDTEALKKLRRDIRHDIFHSSRDRSDIQSLHRSEESRELFHTAAKQAEKQAVGMLTPLHLLEVLFSSGSISLDATGKVVCRRR